MNSQRLGSLPRLPGARPVRRDLLRGLAGLGFGLGLGPGDARRTAAAKRAARCTPERKRACRRAGKTCLGKGSCAIVCAANQDCPATCGCSNPDVAGLRHCIAGPRLPFVECTTATDCPRGHHCQDIGGGGVCIELCG